MAVDPANLRSIAPPERHAVQFYERDEFLCDAVADFLAAGLRAGDPVVAIATEAHRREFSQRLEACGIDLEEAEASGRLVLLDAADTLSTITVDGAPDWELFRTRIGGLIASKRERFGGARVRAYGEMVDLLWKSGNPQAAIRLEEMWSDLGRDLHFSLLCAYAMGNFLKEADGAGFEKICRVHTHVVPAEGYSDGDDPAARLRTIGVLQQRALALESEIEHRKELETALRAALDDRRRAEEELRKSREELRLQNEELSRAVRLSEMFIGILGHDLRNPLSAIVTGASLLYRRAESEKISKPALRILSSAERIWRMIDQILDFTRIRLGHGIPLQRRRIDLAEVCRLAIDEVESLAGEGRIRLEESGESLGVWDGDRLAQLVSNLLGNALAHGKGGTPVVIALDGTDPDEFLLEVHNAGAIPGDILPVLFDPFRGSNHKHERSSGLGLGLFISQQIVRAHGGNIEVSSSEEDGTRFLIRLPRNAPMLTSAFDGRDKG